MVMLKASVEWQELSILSNPVVHVLVPTTHHTRQCPEASGPASTKLDDSPIVVASHSSYPYLHSAA